MSVQEVSDDIKERFTSGSDKVSGWLDDMDPQLKGQLLTALIGAGGGGILGGLLSGSHVGETPSERRMRLLKNALLGALLGGGGGFALQRGVDQLGSAMTPTKEDLKEDYDTAKGLEEAGNYGGPIGGGLSGLLAAPFVNSLIRNNFQTGIRRSDMVDAASKWSRDGGIGEKVFGERSKSLQPGSLGRAEKKQIYDHLIAEGNTPAQARSYIYNLGSSSNQGVQSQGKPMSAPGGFSGPAAVKEHVGKAWSGKTGKLDFLNRLFGTQGTSGAIKKTLKGTKNTIGGAWKNLVPSGASVGRNFSRARLPALVAALGGLGYKFGDFLGSGGANFWNETRTGGDDIKDTIREYKEAPE